LKQADSVWIAPGGPVVVLAAPGYCASRPGERLSEQAVRTFIAAAAKAGADAVELGPGQCTGSIVSRARGHGLHAVARVAETGHVCPAVEAGVKIFHVESPHLDDTLRPTLAQAASCVIVSDPAAHSGFARMKDRGVQVLPLHPHSAIADRLRGTSAGGGPGSDDELFGCELGAAALPASAGGVLVAASGAALVRQYLAVGRYFREEDTPRFLSQKDFREMVESIRATEKFLRPQLAAGGRGYGSVSAPERNARLGRVIPPDHFDNPAGTQSEAARTAVGEGYAILASEVVATVVAIIDLTTGSEIDARALEILLPRLEGALTVDEICAIVAGAEPEGIRRSLTERRIALHRIEENWLAGVLDLVEKQKADVVVWLPADDLLVDPGLLDRMVIRHVKSASDYTLCSDLPPGTSPVLMSAAALRRIGAFTGAGADASTVHKLLSNRRVFRVQETTVANTRRKHDLDLTRHNRKRGLFGRTVQTGAENATEPVERVSDIYGEDCRMSESEARRPLCTYSFVVHGDLLSDTI